MRLKSNIKSKKRQSIMFVIGLLSEPLEDLVSGGCISEDDTCIHSQDILDYGSHVQHVFGSPTGAEAN